MSKNVHQVYLDNPSTTNAADDLFYVGKSPYGLTNDSAIKYSDLSAQFMLYNANLQGLSNLNNADTGIVFQTGVSGGITTYHTALASATSATTFNNNTNGVNWGDQVDFTSSSPKTVTLDASGYAAATGFYWIVINSGSGLLTFSPGIGSTIYGPTTLSGGNGVNQTAMAICRVVNINNTTAVWYVEVVNGFNLLNGTNISLSYSTNGITINTTGAASFSFNTISGTSVVMSSNQGYIPLNASLTSLTLPATFNVGDQFIIRGYGSGGWKLVQNISNNIIIGTKSTTSGATGYLQSTNQNDAVHLVAVVANTTLIANALQGNITVN